ncbi:MAG: MTH938/NDUFAF3 family protein [Anaerolineales bacterium]
MFDDPQGPIEHFSWAKFVINGEEHAKTSGGIVGVGKDIRLIGAEVSAWKARHGHRLTPEMITGVYDRDLDVLILGLGANGALKCPDEVQQAIRAHGIPELILERTPEACRIYNERYHAGDKVALLAHGTC